MANLRYQSIVAKRKVFYICTCPERPASNEDADILSWYMRHFHTCSPRPVVDLPLPDYEGSE